MNVVSLRFSRAFLARPFFRGASLRQTLPQTLRGLVGALWLGGLVVAAACGDAGGSPMDGPATGGVTAATGGAGGAGRTGGQSGSTGGSLATGGRGGSAGRGNGGSAGASSGDTGGMRPGTGGVTGVGGTAGAGVAGAGTGGPGRTGGAGGVIGGRTGGGGSGAGGSKGGASGTGGLSGNWPSGLEGLFPGPGATSVCPDPVLRLTFARAPALGSSGKIEVRNGAGTVVTSVDLGAATFVDKVGSVSLTKQRPVFVEGREVVVVLPHAALGYGQTYTVTVQAGAIKPADGGSFSLDVAAGWRFTTAGGAPANLAALSVALDGSAPFCTVQGAFDALPSSGSGARRIELAVGTYHEIVLVKGKGNVTLHGADRKGTVIAGVNNDDLNAGTANRALVGIDSASGVVIQNLTIRNLTPQGGSQAEALRMQSCDKCVVRDADIVSLQDTLLWSGRIYAKNLYIAGNVDYVWGTGTVFFDQCEIHTTGRAGYNVQARNAANANGYAFVDCKLTADNGITGDVLARIDVSAYPGSQVAYIDCEMGPHISAAGWTITGGSAGSSLRFWEYGSHDASGKAIDTSRRLAGSRRISATEAAAVRDPGTFLGGWTP